jgi:hypothetical protein
MGERARAGERLLHHDAGWKRIFPFHIGTDDAGDVERVLHKMHIGVTRALQLAMQRMRRTAGEQHYRQPIAEQVLNRHAGIRGAGIDMHQHGLRFAGGERVAARHMHGDDLVRTQDDVRVLAAVLVPARHLLDQGDMVGAEIGEDAVDAEIDQAFEEIMRGAVAGHA